MHQSPIYVAKVKPETSNAKKSDHQPSGTCEYAHRVSFKSCKKGSWISAACFLSAVSGDPRDCYILCYLG
jgi:hypothetical protein